VKPLTAQAVADLVGGRLSGSGEVLLRRVRSLERAEADALAMCTGARHAAALAASHAGAVLLPESLAAHPGPANRIIVDDPARAMVLATRALHPEPAVAPGIHASVTLGRDTRIGSDPAIAAHAVIGAGVTIGDRCRIGPQVVIEDGVTIGDDVRLDARVTLYEGTRLGHRVRCKAGAVIGGPGFGFLSEAEGHARIPQVGGCVLDDDVEVGSSTCIDRGSLDDTVVGRGTKIDNVVHIAHNVHIGRDCLIMACVGIAGSCRIGDRVILAGQAGLIDHIDLGDDVKVGAKSAVFGNYASGAAISGYPAKPHREFLRGVAALYRLAPRVSELEALLPPDDDA
jgi:UDP-3-O-[3-hydroxymyristoyl] glucosamine N-acyltransferase